MLVTLLSGAGARRDLRGRRPRLLPTWSVGVGNSELRTGTVPHARCTSAALQAQRVARGATGGMIPRVRSGRRGRRWVRGVRSPFASRAAAHAELITTLGAGTVPSGIALAVFGSDAQAVPHLKDLGGVKILGTSTPWP